MGTDNLFHKRKAKTQRDFKRRISKFAPYDRVLIVCEGSKTEPHYFEEFRNYYSLETANVRVSGECGSDPVSVVEHGKALNLAEQQKGDGYDRVYCVFDKDKHANYQQALDIVTAAKPKNIFFSVQSVPCFEYWLLLHFIYTTAPFSAAGNTSAGDAVLAELKQYWPNYVKASKNTFSYLLNQLDYAKANAARSLLEASNNSTDNPSTHIHILVNYLQNIKKKTAQ